MGWLIAHNSNRLLFRKIMKKSVYGVCEGMCVYGVCVCVRVYMWRKVRMVCGWVYMWRKVHMVCPVPWLGKSMLEFPKLFTYLMYWLFLFTHYISIAVKLVTHCTSLWALFKLNFMWNERVKQKLYGFGFGMTLYHTVRARPGVCRIFFHASV